MFLLNSWIPLDCNSSLLVGHITTIFLYICSSIIVFCLRFFCLTPRPPIRFYRGRKKMKHHSSCQDQYPTIPTEFSWEQNGFDPKSQPLFQSFKSILPTSLTYIIPMTRGCTPWGPDALIGTSGNGNTLINVLRFSCINSTSPDTPQNRGVLLASLTLISSQANTTIFVFQGPTVKFDFNNRTLEE